MGFLSYEYRFGNFVEPAELPTRLAVRSGPIVRWELSLAGPCYRFESLRVTGHVGARMTK